MQYLLIIYFLHSRMIYDIKYIAVSIYDIPQSAYMYSAIGERRWLFTNLAILDDPT